MITILAVCMAFSAVACGIDSTTEQKGEVLSLNKHKITLSVGDKEKLSVDGISESELIWATENDNIAIVDDNGNVSAKAKGQTVVNVKSKDESFSDLCEVSVIINVSSIEIDVSEKTLQLGESFVITATVKPLDAEDKTVLWSSSDESVATVDKNGNVLAKAKGETVITAKAAAGNVSASCTVIVNKNVIISLDKTVCNLGLTESTQLIATVKPREEAARSVEWTSDDPSVATVDMNGVVSATGNKIGSTVITATMTEGNKSAKCAINVMGNIDANNVDFGKSTGSNTDISQNLNFWQYRNTAMDSDVSISKQTAVADSRASGDGAYAFNAIKYSRPQNNGEYRKLTGNMMYITPEIVSRAISLGYKWLTFYLYIPDIPAGKDATRFSVYNCNEDGSLHYQASKSDTILYQKNNEKWTYYSIDLSSEKYHSGAGIGIGTYGREMYLAKVEFLGADISAFANTYLTESSAGKSYDMVKEELIGKMYQTTDNANNSISYTASGSDKETAIGGDDYITFTKTGFANDYYGTNMNTIKISAEWIMAAKKLGYSVIGIWFNNVGGTGMSVRKFAADGTNVDFAQPKTPTDIWHSSFATWGFLSMDLSGFNDGDSLLISIGTTTTVSMSGITFRTSACTPSPALVLRQT